MASAVATRPATDSTSASSSSAQQNQSFSSFPHSRSHSSQSLRTGKPGRPPNPQPVGHSDASSLSSKARSQQSSISGPTRALTDVARKPTKLRSQYPADSAENHVEYILVASFDIDRGSIMEHQYPGPISGDEHMLAELMLPDQAHVRSQDWTIFFLHKDTSADDQAKAERKANRKRRNRTHGKDASKAAADADVDFFPEGPDGSDDEMASTSGSDSEDQDNPDGPPLIYVLNLVNTKRHTEAKR